MGCRVGGSPGVWWDLLAGHLAGALAATRRKSTAGGLRGGVEWLSARDRVRRQHRNIHCVEQWQGAEQRIPPDRSVVEDEDPFEDPGDHDVGPRTHLRTRRRTGQTNALIRAMSTPSIICASAASSRTVGTFR
jgi:hypothetical protein